MPGKLLACVSIDDLAVAQALNRLYGVENDGGSEYRAEEAAAAHLVDTRDAGKAEITRTSLVGTDAPNRPGRRFDARLLTARGELLNSADFFGHRKP